MTATGRTPLPLPRHERPGSIAQGIGFTLMGILIVVACAYALASMWPIPIEPEPMHRSR